MMYAKNERVLICAPMKSTNISLLNVGESLAMIRNMKYKIIVAKYSDKISNLNVPLFDGRC